MVNFYIMPFLRSLSPRIRPILRTTEGLGLVQDIYSPLQALSCGQQSASGLVQEYVGPALEIENLLKHMLQSELLFTNIVKIHNLEEPIVIKFLHALRTSLLGESSSDSILTLNNPLRYYDTFIGLY